MKKIKCIDVGNITSKYNTSKYITLNKVYDLIRTESYNKDRYVIINDLGYEDWFYSVLFEDVVTDKLDLVKQLVENAKSMIGLKVDSWDGCTFTPDKYTLILDHKDFTRGLKSGDCVKYFNKHGFCVVVSDDMYAIPVDDLKIAPSKVTIKLSKDYDAVITENTVTVGCQVIHIDKVRGLVKAHDDKFKK